MHTLRQSFRLALALLCPLMKSISVEGEKPEAEATREDLQVLHPLLITRVLHPIHVTRMDMSTKRPNILLNTFLYPHNTYRDVPHLMLVKPRNNYAPRKVMFPLRVWKGLVDRLVRQ